MATASCPVCPHATRNHNADGCRRRGGAKGCGCGWNPMRQRHLVRQMRAPQRGWRPPRPRVIRRQPERAFSREQHRSEGDG